MGTDVILAVGPDGREYRARDCAAIYMAACKEAYQRKTGEILQAVVISVPANYDQRQREETKAAAESIGLEVLALINEPTAAALGNQIQNRPDGSYLAADWGASTFDVSLLDKSGNNIDVIATKGIPDLGSFDIDVKLVEFALDAFAKEHGFRPDPNDDQLTFLDLNQRAEQCKHTLSRMPTATMVVTCRGKMTCVTVTAAEFLTLVADLNKKAVDCVAELLNENKTIPTDLQELLLVGGGSFTLGFCEGLENALRIKPSFHCEATYAVAYGCVVAGRMELERQNRPLMVGNAQVPPINYFLKEVTSHDIGVTVVTSDYQRLVNYAMLRKGTVIPCDRMMPFKLAGDGYTDARIQLLQGNDGAGQDDCLVLGHCDLLDMPPVIGTPHRIDIRLRIDRNGMFRVWAQDAVSGKTVEMTVDYKTAAAKAKNTNPGTDPGLLTA
jgi:molecular chaperone DnaK